MKYENEIQFSKNKTKGKKLKNKREKTNKAKKPKKFK